MAFGDLMGAYVKKETVKEIDYFISQNNDIYESRNHFIRCSIQLLCLIEQKILNLDFDNRNIKRAEIQRTVRDYDISKSGKNSNESNNITSFRT